MYIVHWSGLITVERVSQLKKIEAECEEKRQILTDELVRIENLLTSAYDRWVIKDEEVTMVTTLQISWETFATSWYFTSNS